MQDNEILRKDKSIIRSPFSLLQISQSEVFEQIHISFILISIDFFLANKLKYFTLVFYSITKSTAFMKAIILFFTFSYLVLIPFNSTAQLTHWCGAMEGLQNRLANDQNYAAFHQLATSIDRIEQSSLPCDASNSVVIPLAFHFDDTFSCVDVNCLLSKVQEQIDVLNYAYADNSSYQQNIDLNAACPTGYPLADVSTGTCIEFRLGVAPAGQGLDPACDPAITIGEFGGGTQTGLGGAGAGWAGYLNIFVVEAVAIYGFPFPGIIGVADGIPGAASGDGVTILADAFGGAGAACSSGNDLDIGATANGSTFFTEGGTTVHEVGHYLGLYHIWGDDQPIFGGTPPYCTGDDSTMPQVGPFVVNDTPLQSESTATDAPCPTIAGATCTSLPSSCDGSNDYFHNYMDYSNDVCFSMFTSDQSMVVNYWANELFGGSTIPTFTSVPGQLATVCDMQPCSACASVNLDILFDGFPGQTSWDISDSNGSIVASGGSYSSQAGNSTINISPACLPDGCYDLNVYDALNNGMCPFQSSAVGVATFITPGTLITPGSIVGTLSLVTMPGLCGNYTLTDASGGILATGGGDFGAQQSNNFCLSGGVVAPRQGNVIKSKLTVIPNPAINQISVSHQLKNETLHKVQITDALGKTVLETTNLTIKHALDFDVSQFKTGIYIIRLFTAQGEVNTKFIKQ